jgi:hypothetical protein
MSFGSIGYRNKDSKTFYNNVKSLRSTRTVSVFGDPQIDTTDFKYGSGSGAFDSVGDSLSVPPGSDSDLGTMPFCIETWVKFNNTTATHYLFDYRQYSFSTVPSVYFDGANSRMVFQTATTIRITKTHTFDTDNWFHIALTRSGTSFRLFVNGEPGGTWATSASMSSPSPMFIGRGILSSSVNFLNGKLDDFCITRGDAKYTEAFTPPAAKLLDYDNVVLRLDFDGDFLDKNL